MIRPFKLDDKESLLRIFRLNIPEFFDKNEIKDFEEYLNQNAETYLTVEVDNTIVGGTGYYVNEDDNSGRITWIFFDPSYSGKGLGKQSVEYCLKIFREDKMVKKLIVTTSQLAYRFFEKFDYSINRIEKNYWGEGLDLYEMEKTNE
ncbi:GNAT family N-acetyltransferase [Aquimarina sp. U1-2]|uniref:GNAT family N-acetyltransferase n=1 Tax=Aquimarina sp. U1-2 TaxID=2823141 RepID=UPI001AECDCE3|nr:GNAT family N-acetyltransferase [Aquimarina sp. U1-2]MBP2832136.1 GNAT family N-acetyltransferase [Aquimarina sp. U1-2]